MYRNRLPIDRTTSGPAVLRPTTTPRNSGYLVRQQNRLWKQQLMARTSSSGINLGPQIMPNSWLAQEDCASQQNQSPEHTMPKDSSRQWNTSPLLNESWAWFVNRWLGKHAGVPEAEMLFVLETPRSRCLSMQVVADSTCGWEHQMLCRLGSENPTADTLITDDSRFQPILVDVGASFQRPTPYKAGRAQDIPR